MSNPGAQFAILNMTIDRLRSENAAQAAQIAELQKEVVLFNRVLDLVDQWQKDGRVGFCLPVIRFELLGKLETAVDKRRRANCETCSGIGHIDEHEHGLSRECPDCQRPNA